MKNTKIEWCDHTWNPWRGCSRVERALDCVNCYAAKLGHRFGIEWGPNGIRVQKGEAGWREPFRWARKPWVCDECGTSRNAVDNGGITPRGGESYGKCTTCDDEYASFHRARVFALSMGDWLEDEPRTWTHGGQPQGGIPAAWLARMLDTIRQTPQLNYILLTKRPQNFDSRMQDVRGFAEASANHELLCWVSRWMQGTPPDNVCLMTSVGYQEAAHRISELLRIPARWHGLSLEPLLGPVALWLGAIKLQRPERFWLIHGGESGHGARPCNVAWIRDIRDQGEIAGCPVFVKQLGSCPVMAKHDATGTMYSLPVKLKLKHPKGGDMAEWPEDLRVRQFPEGM